MGLCRGCFSLLVSLLSRSQWEPHRMQALSRGGTSGIIISRIFISSSTKDTPLALIRRGRLRQACLPFGEFFSSDRKEVKKKDTMVLAG